MVNGFHFTGRTSTAQIYLTGGDASKTLDLRISNNLFNCYTDGAANNGSVVHGISAVQKTGSIEDNYFHLTKIPTYTDSSGKTVNYTNRGITLRNLKDITIIANYFDGYTGSKMRPFWLSSEVASGSTTPGYGNVAILGNRFENSYPGALHINNIRGGTTANILIAANSYGGQKMNIDFSQTANQTSQNLPTDKSKITFQVQTNDYPNLNITPASPGVTAKKFTYYVTFRSEDGMYIYGNAVVSGTTATYKGVTPTKAATAGSHYTFKGWMTEKNGTTAANLSSIKANTNVYASFTATAHTTAMRGQQSPTCTTPGATGEKYCTVCNHVITPNAQLPATGHTEVVDPGVAPTCTETGLTEGKHCETCGTVIVAREEIPATDHTEVVDPAKAPTCTETGLTEGKHCETCGNVLVAQEEIPATGHSYTYDPVDAATHAIGCENCDYTATESHAYTEGACICGEIEIKEPVVDEAIVINHTLNLASDISVNFAVRADMVQNYVNHYLVCEIPVYEGNVQTGTRTVTIEPTLNGYFYYYTLTGLTAVNMGDVVSARLHMEKDGQAYLSKVDTYSIAQYAYSQLNKVGADPKLKALCADLLRYGKEAQIFKAYRTDSLADTPMTEAHRAYLSDIEAVTFGNTNRVLNDLENAPITWVGKALNLESKVALKFVFSLGSYSGNLSDLMLCISYEDAYGNQKTELLANPAPYGQGTGAYVFTVDSLLAAELRAVVSAQIYSGDTPVSPTLQYSADTYGNNKTGTLLDLCKALMAYSDSARSYFAK